MINLKPKIPAIWMKFSNWKDHQTGLKNKTQLYISYKRHTLNTRTQVKNKILGKCKCIQCKNKTKVVRVNYHQEKKNQY